MKEAPTEAIILNIDPESVTDAIDFDNKPEVEAGTMERKHKRNFWLFIGAFAVLGALVVVTDNGWLSFFWVIGFFLLLNVGIKVIKNKESLGWKFTGAVILVAAMVLYGSTLVPHEVNEEYKSDGGALQRAYDKQGSDSYKCPHCAGMGVRLNQITGDIGQCSSCGGDGQVSQEQYNSLSK